MEFNCRRCDNLWPHRQSAPLRPTRSRCRSGATQPRSDTAASAIPCLRRRAPERDGDEEVVDFVSNFAQMCVLDLDLVPATTNASRKKTRKMDFAKW